MNLKNFIYTFLFSSVLFFLLGSCRQRGCTDPKALNYNVTADDDDGSCIYCKENVSTLDTLSVMLKDDNFNSPHFNQNIARFFIHQQVLTPNDLYCGGQKMTFSLKAYSLISQNMYLPFRIQRYQGPVYFYLSDDIVIDAGDSLDLGLMQTLTNSPLLPLSLDSIVTYTQGEVIYY